MRLVCHDRTLQLELENSVRRAVLGGHSPAYVEMTPEEYARGRFAGPHFEVACFENGVPRRVTVEIRLVPA